MSDADKVHRWMTQAELDAMLEAARREGRQQAIEDSPTLSQTWDAIHAAKMLEDEARVAYRRGAEARAEVERLKVQAEAHETRHRLAASEIRGLLASLSDARHEGNRARAEAVSAFRRGAEAMREAAISKADNKLAAFLRCSPNESRVRQAVTDGICALPVPEDKS